MKPFLFYLNENFESQIKPFIILNYGEEEYKALENANPVSLLDGLMSMSITTKEKPNHTTPTTLTQSTSGWISFK